VVVVVTVLAAEAVLVSMPQVRLILQRVQRTRLPWALVVRRLTEAAQAQTETAQYLAQ
jgi:hypothetical protein